MSLALHWARKEWRAQRAFLLGYLGLALTTASAGLAVAQWRAQFLGSNFGHAGIVLWFVLLSALAGLFATSQVVSGEVVGRDDQLWRRLPGALRPAFFGKLLFLLLLCPGLVLLGIAAGQLFLVSFGKEPVPLPALLASLAPFNGVTMVWLMLLPWLLAAAFWMPKARLALGVVVVLAAGLAATTSAVLTFSRGLEHRPGWPDWLAPYAALVGLLAAFVSCVVGRRGGDHRRSAGCGGLVLLLGLVPPGAWLGSWVVAYWRPDVAELASLDLVGITPDGRHAVVRGPAQYQWPELLVRVDLATGAAVALTGPDEVPGVGWIDPTLTSEAAIEAGWYGANGVLGRRLFDVVSGEAVPLPAAAVETWRARCTSFRQPGDLPAIVRDGELELVQPDGAATRLPFAYADRSLVPAGHGIRCVANNGHTLWFDLTLRQFVWLPLHGQERGRQVFAVQGRWLLAPPPNGAGSWRCYDPTTEAQEALEALPAGSEWLGLLDDGTALFSVARSPRQHVLVCCRPASRECIELPLPDHPWRQGECTIDAGLPSPLLYGQRDPRGHRLVRLHRGRQPGNLFLAIDPGKLAVEVLLATELLTEIAAFTPDGAILASEDHRRIVRYAVDSRQRSVVYPRHER